MMCIHQRIAQRIEFCLDLVGIFGIFGNVIFGLIGLGPILSDGLIAIVVIGYTTTYMFIKILIRAFSCHCHLQMIMHAQLALNDQWLPGAAAGDTA